MADSKIKFSVEGMTELHQSFQKILDDSKALTGEWEAQGNSIIESLKKQIELLKERNSYGKPDNLYVGGGSQAVKSHELNDIEAVLESIQTDGVLIHKDSLKELAEILKTTPAGGGVGAPGGVGGSDSSSQGGLGKTGQFLRNFAVSTLLNPLGTNDPLNSLLSAGSNVGMSLMGMGGGVGLAGAALAAVLNIIGAQYKTVAGVAPTAAETARLLGGDWTSWVPAERGTLQYGLQRNDVLQRRMQLARAMGRQNLGSSFDQSLLWEMTTMLSSADIAEFARSGRGDARFDLSRNMGGYFEMLKRSGISNEKIQTQMSEYLRELVSLNQLQLEQFGRTDTSLNTAIYSAIAGVFPEAAASNPALIGRLSSGFYRGMSNASSRQIEALQYYTASRAMGGRGSWYEARMMREDPFGLAEGLTEAERQRRLQYSSELLRQYRSAAGGTEQFAYLLEKQFGFNANQAMSLARSFDLGQFDISDFKRQAEQTKQADATEQALRQKLPETVDEISKMLAQWEAFKIGQDVSGIKEATEGIYKLLGGDREPKPKGGKASPGRSVGGGTR